MLKREEFVAAAGYWFKKAGRLTAALEHSPCAGITLIRFFGCNLSLPF